MSISKEFLANFQRYVKAQGLCCYIDLLDNDYNEEGFQEKLVGILKNCDIFLVMDSPEYFDSKWAHKEFEVANELGLKILKVASTELKNMQESNTDLLELID